MNLTESQIAALTGQAPSLLDLNDNSILDNSESITAGQFDDLELEDLVAYLVEERLREHKAPVRQAPVAVYDYGLRPDGASANPA